MYCYFSPGKRLVSRLICLGLIGLAGVSLAWAMDAPNIDAYVSHRYKKAPDLSVKYRVGDRQFARRAYLDLAGRLPSREELNEFLVDTSPVRRQVLVDRLLRSDAFTERLTALIEELFFNQMLAEEAPYRNAFRKTIRKMVADDRGWDQIATTILTDSGELDESEAANFVYALEFFEEDYPLDRIDDTIGNLSEAFLGVKIDCISCHDGAGHLERVNKGLSVMKRHQFWGMAAFISGVKHYRPVSNVTNRRVTGVVDVNTAPFSPDQGTLLDEARFQTGEYLAESGVGDGMRTPRNGGTIAPTYLFTGETPEPGEDRREALARMMTADRQFARNMVNRVWAHLFGQGFVEPLNQWDLGLLNAESAASFESEVQATDPRLMEELTDFFIASRFNLRTLFQGICNSGLYQLDKNHFAADDSGLPPWLTRSRIRRMEAETLVDSLAVALQQPRRYMVSGIYDQTFDSAWALMDENEPSGEMVLGGEGVFRFDPRNLGFRHLGDFLKKQRGNHELLERLGRPNRSQRAPRDPVGNIQGILSLFNSEVVFDPLFNAREPIPLVVEWTQALNDQVKTGEQVARDMFVYLLYREPTTVELEASLGHLSGRESGQAIADMFWALLNHPDFSYK